MMGYQQVPIQQNVVRYHSPGGGGAGGQQQPPQGAVATMQVGFMEAGHSTNPNGPPPPSHMLMHQTANPALQQQPTATVMAAYEGATVSNQNQMCSPPGTQQAMMVSMEQSQGQRSHVQGHFQQGIYTGQAIQQQQHQQQQQQQQQLSKNTMWLVDMNPTVGTTPSNLDNVSTATNIHVSPKGPRGSRYANANHTHTATALVNNGPQTVVTSVHQGAGSQAAMLTHMSMMPLENNHQQANAQHPTAELVISSTATAAQPQAMSAAAAAQMQQLQQQQQMVTMIIVELR